MNVWFFFTFSKRNEVGRTWNIRSVKWETLLPSLHPISLMWFRNEADSVRVYIKIRICTKFSIKEPFVRFSLPHFLSLICFENWVLFWLEYVPQFPSKVVLILIFVANFSSSLFPYAYPITQISFIYQLSVTRNLYYIYNP